MADNENFGTWNSLGVVYPLPNTWNRFPIVSVTGNDLIKIKFIPRRETLTLKGRVWLRSRFSTGNTSLALPATKVALVF